MSWTTLTIWWQRSIVVLVPRRTPTNSSKMNESGSPCFHIRCKRVTSRAWMRCVTHVNDSNHAYLWITLHIQSRGCLCLYKIGKQQVTKYNKYICLRNSWKFFDIMFTELLSLKFTELPSLTLIPLSCDGPGLHTLWVRVPLDSLYTYISYPTVIEQSQ